MKYLLIAILSLFIFTCADAQSPFKAEPLLKLRGAPAMRAMAETTTPTIAIPLSATEPDSIHNVWRFGVTISPVGYTLAGVYQASAGVEFGYQHQDYSYATQTNRVLWSANGVWIPINTSTPITSIQQLESLGALFGFDNNLIQVGPFVNPNAPGPFKNKAGFWAVLGINLN